MSLYLGTTEITKLRDLAPQSGLDITDLWFGSTNVYTVWGEYEGALPATINANGADMRQYQIYGNTGGVGEPTENLFDISTATIGKYIDDTGAEKSSTASDLLFKLNHSDFININPKTDYVFAYKGSRLTADQRIAFCWYTDSKVFLYRDTYLTEPPLTEYQFSNTSPSNAKYLIINFYGYNNNAKYTLTEGTTAPASFVPFGYEVDMVTGSNILQSSEIEWGGWQAAAETIPSKIVNPARCRSKNMYPISGEKIFYNFKSLNVNIAFIKSDERSLGGTGFKIGAGSVDVPADAVKCLFIIANTDIGTNITPAQVIAAGIWASVDTTTTPIYIGDDPLDKDEHIDYQAGKIYRMIDSTLTPTDPPVALPALPTCEGETVIDYAGSGTAPEKVLLKYRKEGF